MSGYAATLHGFPYFSQNDSRWNGIRYGGKNIGFSGCGPTSAAMVLKSYGFDVTPKDTAALFTKAMGGYQTTSGGVCFPQLAKAPYNLTVKNSKSISEVVTALKNGIPVIANPQGPCDFTQNGHFIVLCGISGDNQISVNDPNGSHYEMCSSKTWTAEYIKYCCIDNNCIDGFWIISKNGKGSIGNNASTSVQTLTPKKTITVPAGLGKYYTYETWNREEHGMIPWDKGTKQERLITESKSRGEYKFDKDGYGKIGERYVIAMTSTYGDVGDYVDVYCVDGRIIKAIMGDEKSQTYEKWENAPANKWGHENGQCIVEWMTNWGKHDNPKGNGGVTKVINYGSYFDNPGYATGTDTYMYSENSYTDGTTEPTVVWNNRVHENIHEKLQNFATVPSNGTLALYINGMEITPYTGNLSWENSMYELSATMSFETPKTDAAYLKDWITVPVCGDIVQMVTNVEVFRGVVIKVDDGSRTVNKYTAADLGWYLNKTSQTYQFKNITSADAIKELCADLSINIVSLPELTANINQIYFDKTISAILTDILEQCGGDYNYDFTPEGLRIYKVGDLAAYPEFRIASNIPQDYSVTYRGNVSHTSSIEDMKNSVKVTSEKDNVYTELVVKQNRDSISRYGFLQEIVKIDTEKENAETVAAERLNELCKVGESYSFEIIEKYDSYTRAGETLNIDGVTYIIESTSHSFKGGQHYNKLEVKRI